MQEPFRNRRDDWRGECELLDMDRNTSSGMVPLLETAGGGADNSTLGTVSYVGCDELETRASDAVGVSHFAHSSSLRGRGV